MIRREGIDPVEAEPSADAAIVLNAALEAMPQGFSLWDEHFNLVLWNQRYLKIYGLPADRFYRGVSLREVCEVSVATGNHPGTTPSALFDIYADRLRSCSGPGASRVYEKNIRGRAIEAGYLRAPGLGWLVTHEDVTEQKRRESELKRQNVVLDAALDSMPYGFCMWDAGLRLTLWNQRFADLYGLGPADVRVGATLVEIFLASTEVGNHQGRTAGELSNDYRSRLASMGGETLVTEEVLVNGRIVKVSHMRAPDGVFVATHEDITEQKDRLQELQQRESELQHQNMRFDVAVNNMSQGLCMFDRDKKLIICNRPYAELYSLPVDLVRPGTTLADIMRSRVERGVVPATDAEAYVQRRIDMVSGRKEAVDTVELQDGRIISVHHHPMADGGWVSTHQDITEERRTEARIRHLARHDGLTDLPNRMLFRERMDEAEIRIRRGETIGVLVVDLDHFKTVNDLFGHGTGDALLREAARRLLAACREGDVVARFGGDEFAILHGQLSSPEDAAALANRIVRTIAEPFEFQGHQVVTGASVGIAIAPGDGTDAETLMKNADLALYRAKAEGRGTFHFFEPGMDAALQQRLSFEVDLRSALANNELSLVYQPLVRLKDNRICGAEALLRWNHPTRGTVMPDAIIPIAEDTGLIVPIGEWVLREACAAAAKWPGTGRVAVNLSSVQFKHRDLTQHVISALALTGLDADRLELEVTESVLLAENALTLKTLHQIRGLGVRISMDDFGTGYSSLSYLRSFPFDKIKIDQSFIHDISTRQDSLAIIKAVIGLGRSLGIATTAEGVETDDQLDLVRGEGCTEVQGFLFSPPLPAAAVGRLFAETTTREPDRLAAS